MRALLTSPPMRPSRGLALAAGMLRCFVYATLLLAENVATPTEPDIRPSDGGSPMVPMGVGRL